MKAHSVVLLALFFFCFVSVTAKQLADNPTRSITDDPIYKEYNNLQSGIANLRQTTVTALESKMQPPLSPSQGSATVPSTPPTNQTAISQPGAATANGTSLLSSREIIDAMKLIQIDSVDAMNWMMKNNMYVPITFVIARPWVRLQMGSAALMQSGGQLGKTFYANPMTEVGNDANTMMVFLHFAMYLKTGIEDADKMILMRNILIQGYKSGNDTRFLDPMDSDHVESFQSGILQGSMICFAEDAHFDVRTPAIDITGEFHPSWHANDAQAQGTRLLLARALGEHFMWKQAGPSVRSELLPRKEESRSGKPNTFCLPCQCAYWNNTRGDYSTVSANAGHYGPDAEYDGSGKVRNMQQTYYTPPQIMQSSIMA